MVAIFTGAGAGAERGSGGALGSRGLIGSAALGRSGEQVSLNAATGNLLIAQRDEFLVGQGPDSAIGRTYNSYEDVTDGDNGDHWRQSSTRAVHGLTGTLNATGSTIKRTSGDGSDVTYTWNGSTYVTSDGAGAYDTLANASGVWTWTDSDTQLTEKYNAYGTDYWRITEFADPSGSKLSFTYAGAHLDKVTTQNGEYEQYSWSGNNITQITTGYTDLVTSTAKTLTRTRYGYDVSNRLTSVIVDLTPADNSVSDGATYVTNYAYDGSSNRVASITQTDGSSLAIGYDSSGRVSTLTQGVATGVTRLATISYGSGYTTITDQLSQVTRLNFDTSNRLTAIILPPANSGASSQITQFTYDINGNVLTTVDALGNTTTDSYDGSGNVVSETDRLGNVVTRTFGSQNQLLSEARVGADSSASAATHTTRYVYDNKLRLNYIVSAEGDVTELRRDDLTGNLWERVVYDGQKYTGGSYTWNDLNSWATSTGVDGTALQQTNYQYDARGALIRELGFDASNSRGSPSGGDGWYDNSYTYNQAGQLLSSITATQNTNQYVYDGLGRLTSSVDLNGGTTSVVFNDASMTTVVTLASGLVTTSTYDKAGELLSVGQSGTGIVGTRTANYQYDQLGRLYKATDANGTAQYHVYDALGRKVADVDSAGAMVEYRYDAEDRVIATIRYNTAVSSFTTLNAGTATAAGIRPSGGPADIWTWQVYDQEGRVVEAIDGTGDVTGYRYDASDRLVDTTLCATKLTATQLTSLKTMPLTMAANRLNNSQYGGISGWYLDSNPNGIADPGQPYTGDWMGKSYFKATYTATAAGQTLSMATDAASWFAVTAGERLSVQTGIEVCGPVGAIALSIVWRDASGTTISTTIGSTTGSQSYNTKLSGFTTVPAGAVSARLRFAFTTTGAGTGWMAMVEPMVSQANAAQTGYPGFTPTPAADGARDHYTRNFYNKDGWLTGQLDANGYLTQYTYDAAGQLKQQTAFGTATNAAYRATGTLSQLTAGLASVAVDRTTHYAYDEQGHLTFIVDAQNQVTEYGYPSDVAWGAVGDKHRTVQYSAPIATLSTYSMATIRSAILSAGVATSPNNRISFAVYNAADKLAYAIDATGAVVGYTYDAVGNLVQTVRYSVLDTGLTSVPSKNNMDSWAASNANSTNDRRTIYFYSAAGELLYTLDAEGYVTENDYDPGGQLTTVKRWNTAVSANVTPSTPLTTFQGYLTGTSITTSYTRDGEGRVATVTDGAGVVTKNVYNSNGTLESTYDAYGTGDQVRTYFLYDAAEQVTSRYDAYGTNEQALTTFTYDAFGQQVQVTDPSSNSTYFYYDKLGRVIATRNAADYVTETSYNAFGETASVTHRFNAANNVASAATLPTYIADSAHDGTSSFDYDQLGRVIRARDAEDYITESSYTVFGDLQSVTHRYNPATGTSNTSYNPDSTRDAITCFEYDKLGRVTKTTDAEGHPEFKSYNAFGQVASETNKLGGTTSYIYDHRGLLLSDTTQIGGAATTTVVNGYGYDARGNRTSVVEGTNLGGAARTTSYSYDFSDRVSMKTGPAARISTATALFAGSDTSPVERYFYDKRDNLVQSVDANGGSTYYAYDRLDRKTAQMDPMGSVQTWAYDVNGNVAATRTYDTAVVPATNWAQGLSGSFRETTYTYDKLNRIKTTSVAGVLVGKWNGSSYGTTTQTVTTSVDYDAVGNVVRSVDGNGNATFSYYDRLGRQTGKVDPASYLTTWIRDAEGNVLLEARMVQKVNGAIASSNPYTLAGSATDARVTLFSYDRTGNRLSERRLSADNLNNYIDANGNLAKGLARGSDQRNPDVDGVVGQIIRLYDVVLGRAPNAQEIMNTTAFMRAHPNDPSPENIGQYGPNMHNDSAAALEAVASAILQDASVAQRMGTYADNATFLTNLYRFAFRRAPTTDELSNWSSNLSNGWTRGGALALFSDWPDHRYYVDGQSSLVSYTYNAAGQVRSKTEATGDVTAYTYDNAGRLITEALVPHAVPGGSAAPTTNYAYDNFGDLLSTDQNGHVTTNRYDGAGRLQQTVDAIGQSRWYSYDAVGRKIAEAYVRSGQWEGLRYGYDAAGRLITQGYLTSQNGLWTASGDETQFSYNAHNEVIEKRLGNAGAQGITSDTYTYDSAGHLWRCTSAGVWHYFAYDANGNQTMAIESGGIANSTIHDLGSIAAAQALASDSGVSVTYTLFDARGQASEVHQPNRQLKVDGVGVELVSRRSYNAFGEVVTDTDANGAVTTYDYNAMGRTTKVTHPGVSVMDEHGSVSPVAPTESYSYDVAGRLIATTDANGNTIRRALLAGSGYGGGTALVTAEWHPDGGKVTNAYDVYGNLVQATDAVNRVTTMTYDALGRLGGVTRPSGIGEGFEYDVLGHRTRHYTQALDTYHEENTNYDIEGRVVRTRSYAGDVVTTGYAWNGGVATANTEARGGWTVTSRYYQGLDTNADGTAAAPVRQSSQDIDQFGRVSSSTDLGGHQTSYSYDSDGRAASSTGAVTGTTRYLNSGFLGSATSGAVNSAASVASYGYDANGNRTSETLTVGGLTYENATASYDAMGRMTAWSEAGTAAPGSASAATAAAAAGMTWSYDAVGNIRQTAATHATLDTNGAATGSVTENRYFLYDAMNRVVLDRGALVGGQIVRGTTGTSWTYDGGGQRATATRDALLTGQVWVTTGPGTGPRKVVDDGGSGQMRTVSYQGQRRESYTYTGDGQLAGVSIMATSYNDDGMGHAVSTGAMDRYAGDSTYSYNGLDRLSRQVDHDANGAVAYDHQLGYDWPTQRVTWDSVTQLQGGATVTTTTTTDYGAGSSYALGSAVVVSASTTRNGQAQGTTTTTNSYVWYSAPALGVASATGATPATTSYGYGAGGVLESVSIADGRARTVSFVNDTNGQALRRDEADANYSQGDPHEVWYRFAGREIGHLGNNAAGASDYATSIAQREAAAGTGPFGNGDVSYGSDFATEDPGAITSFVQGAAGGSYTVRAGDTLASIAQALWGDASLWYKLAQANTLTGDAQLSAGQVLTVPLGVQRSGYSAVTFKPYDALDVLGDVSPVNPAPVAQAQGGHKHGCGVFGQILLTVVAVAVVVLSHGALTAALGGSSVLGGAAAGVAGSIVSQGVGLATGIQDRFSFSGVALAAIGGGVGGALTKVSAFGDASGIAKFGSDVVRGALGSAIGQGIGIATGLQSSFSWASVAAAGLGAGVGGAVGRALHVEPFATERSVGNIAATAATGAANALANAAAHTLIDGSDFGDNVLAALPDVIGQTVGQLAAGAVTGRPRLAYRTDDLLGDDAVTGDSAPNGPGIPFSADIDPRDPRFAIGAARTLPDGTPIETRVVSQADYNQAMQQARQNATKTVQDPEYGRYTGQGGFEDQRTEEFRRVHSLEDAYRVGPDGIAGYYDARSGSKAVWVELQASADRVAQFDTQWGTLSAPMTLMAGTPETLGFGATGTALEVGGGLSTAGKYAMYGRSAAEAVESVPSRLIGSYTPTAELKYGTTLFGDKAHAAAGTMLRQQLEARGVTGIIDRTGPGLRGVDMSVDMVSAQKLGFRHIEIKPNTPSGMRSFNRQVAKWGYDPSSVRAVTYDANGNLRWGFDF